MIIWSSINCPMVICLPTVCYLSRERPLVKPTAPGSSFSYICFVIYFSFAFLLRSIKPKIQKIPCCTLFYLRSIISIQYNFLPSVCLSWGAVPERDWQTFNTSGCKVLLFVCRCCLRCDCLVLLLVRCLGFITEGNTYRCCATSSSPLGGNTDVVLATPSGPFYLLYAISIFLSLNLLL